MKRASFILLVPSAALILVVQLQTALAVVTWSGNVLPADPTTWTNVTTGYVGRTADGSLRVDAGSGVMSRNGYLGYDAAATGVLTVDGAGSAWTNSNYQYVGYHGTGELRITNGATVSSDYSYLGYYADAMGEVIVTGIGSTWTNQSRLFVGNSGSGTLTMTAGGTVTAPEVSLNAQSLLALTVSGDTRLIVGGGAGLMTNDGTVRLIAEVQPGAGHVYTPILAGTWAGSGVYEALGGTWNGVDREFIVSDVEVGTSGTPVSIDLADKQGVRIDDATTGWSVGVSFLAKTASTSFEFTATAIDGDILTGLENHLGPGDVVLGGWEFTTSGGYVSGDPAYLSFNVGPADARERLAVWYYDGADWTEYDASDVIDDGNHASFTVTGFSGYAVTGTAVPEPSTLVLLALGLLGSIVCSRRRNW